MSVTTPPQSRKGQLTCTRPDYPRRTIYKLRSAQFKTLKNGVRTAISFTQALTPTQLTVGSGVGAEKAMVEEDGRLVVEEPLLVGNGDLVVVDMLVMEVERGIVTEVVEWDLLLVGRLVMIVDEGVVAGVDPPVIIFLTARS